MCIYIIKLIREISCALRILLLNCFCFRLINYIFSMLESVFPFRFVYIKLCYKCNIFSIKKKGFSLALAVAKTTKNVAFPS